MVPKKGTDEGVQDDGEQPCVRWYLERVVEAEGVPREGTVGGVMRFHV